MPFLPVRRVVLAAALALAACQSPPLAEPGSAPDPTARLFEDLKASPAVLQAFLRAMPKGADLHSHLSGAVYAESYVRSPVRTASGTAPTCSTRTIRGRCWTCSPAGTCS